jgi:hypothetical protein
MITTAIRFCGVKKWSCWEDVRSSSFQGRRYSLNGDLNPWAKSGSRGRP